MFTVERQKKVAASAAEADAKRKYEFEVYAKEHAEETPSLIRAIMNDDANEVKRLLKLKKSRHIDEVDQKYNMGPLHWAAALGREHFIGSLLNEGADVNQRSKNDETAVFVAAACDQGDVITTLVRLKKEVIKINSLNKEKKTPIAIATENGCPTAITALRIAGVDIDELSQGETLLCIAARLEQVNSIQALTEKLKITYTRTYWGKKKHITQETQADINQRNNNGDTLLHIAAFFRRVKLADFLIEKGLDVNAQNKDGKTPVHLAAENGDKNMLRVLTLTEKIRKLVQVDTPDNNGKTPLMRAVEKKKKGAVAVLLYVGANEKLSISGSSCFSSGLSAFEMVGKRSYPSATIRHLVNKKEAGVSVDNPFTTGKFANKEHVERQNASHEESEPESKESNEGMSEDAEARPFIPKSGQTNQNVQKQRERKVENERMSAVIFRIVVA